MPSSVVFMDKSGYTCVQLPSTAGGGEIDVLPFQCSEKPFGEGIICDPAFAIHADPYACLLKEAQPVLWGVLWTPVGVDDLRFAVLSDGSLNQFRLGFLLKAIVLAYDKAAVQV